jgi:hypothetical protein
MAMVLNVSRMRLVIGTAKLVGMGAVLCGCAISLPVMSTQDAATRTAVASTPAGQGTTVSGETPFWSPVVTAIPLAVTGTPLYPFKAYVTASGIPYDASNTIKILPVFEKPNGRWLGDFTAGQEVEVQFMESGANNCYVSGMAVQGWKVEGWVWCGRLSLTPPTGAN